LARSACADPQSTDYAAAVHNNDPALLPLFVANRRNRANGPHSFHVAANSRLSRNAVMPSKKRLSKLDRYSADSTELVIVEHAHTDIGTIYLGQRERINGTGWVFEIKIDASLLMSSVSPVSERRLSSSALSRHLGEAPLRVLIGGLGLGYTAKAALEDLRVASVRVVEKMDFVIDWMERGLLPLSEEFATEERLEIIQGDVYGYLLGTATETYDLILVDVDHAPDDRLSAASDPFYTVDGQRCVARHLNPGGVLGVWSAFGNDEFAAVLSEVYRESDLEAITWSDDEEPGSSYDNVVFFGCAS
jgi:hypothetical protein